MKAKIGIVGSGNIGWALKQMLKEEASNLTAQPGISAQLIVTSIEGNIGRYIRYICIYIYI